MEENNNGKYDNFNEIGLPRAGHAYIAIDGKYIFLQDIMMKMKNLISTGQSLKLSRNLEIKILKNKRGLTMYHKT